MAPKWFIFIVIMTALCSANSYKSCLPENILKTHQCSTNTACRWEIYKQGERVIDYCLENTCYCPPNTECSISHEDKIIQGIVFKCRIPVVAG